MKMTKRQQMKPKKENWNTLETFWTHNNQRKQNAAGYWPDDSSVDMRRDEMNMFWPTYPIYITCICIGRAEGFERAGFCSPKKR